MTGTLPADDILRTAAGFSPAAFAAAALPVSSPFLISRSIDAVALQRDAPFVMPQEQSVRSASDQVNLFISGTADRHHVAVRRGFVALRHLKLNQSQTSPY